MNVIIYNVIILAINKYIIKMIQIDFSFFLFLFLNKNRKKETSI